MKSFGQNLKKFRKEKKYSQKVLAEKLGVGQTTIANYETDFRFPNEQLLKSLADILEISIDELLGRNQVEKVIPLITDIDQKVKQFLELVMNYDDEEAIELVLDLARKGFDVLDIYHYFIRETLYLVGDLWEKGEISIAMEHHITAVIDRVLIITSTYTKKKPTIKKKAVFLTLSNEPHLIGVKIVREYFRTFGWKTYFLGTDLPWKEILRLMKSEQIDVICISVTLQQNINQSQAFVEYIRENTKAKVMIGGQALHLKNQIITQINPDYYTDNREELLELLNKISK
jgi:methanogenic corrinoid protein MtbC1